MGREPLQKRLDSCQKLLVGLGEEWRIQRDDQAGREHICQAYDALYGMIRDRDYFIVTMATDAVIFDTPLGSREEEAASFETPASDSWNVDDETMAKLNRLFPPEKAGADCRWQRIVAPCGNETWRQCSLGCTKDIWEPGEIPDDICPHCKAPLTGNTIDAHPYIEEGYLPQWSRYNQWLAGTLGKELLILELGVGFSKPGVIRFPFERTAYFNQKAFLYRVHAKIPQTPEELRGRTEEVEENSVAWVRKKFISGGQ